MLFFKTHLSLSASHCCLSFADFNCAFVPQHGIFDVAAMLGFALLLTQFSTAAPQAEKDELLRRRTAAATHAAHDGAGGDGGVHGAVQQVKRQNADLSSEEEMWTCKGGKGAQND
jgi:hypothetical protein